MARRALLALALGAFGVFPAAAHAGTYDVYSCDYGGAFFGNSAWTGVNNALGGDASYTTPDTTCARPGDPVAGLVTKVPVSFGNGVFSRVQFVAPTDARIVDFDLRLAHAYKAVGQTVNGAKQPDNTMYTIAVFGAYAVSLAGQYDGGVTDYVDAEHHWWGRGGPIDTGTIALTRAASPAALKQGTAQTLTLSSGCANAAGCTLDGTSHVRMELYGSKVTIEDLRPPVITAVASGQGLLAPGVRSGGEPITFSASDNTGIRRAEIVDVTDASRPVVVASEDYDAGALTDAGARCNYTRPRPCPDVKGETIAASPAIGGRRTLIVRVTDAGGDTAVSAPFNIVARGPLNGVNGGDGARLTAGFPARTYRGKGKKRRRVYVLRPSRLVSYGKGATIRGILRNAAGLPIGGADVRILVREDRIGANYVDRGGVTTGADGRFRLTVPKGSSRLFRLGYRAYLGDDAFAARSTSHLNVRARISVRGPRRVRPRGRATFTGRLVGRPFPPRGVTLDLQIFQPGRGWRVFANTRTRKNGRFRVSYRFNSAITGRFTFRLRLRPNDAYPYARGVSRRMRVRVG